MCRFLGVSAARELTLAELGEDLKNFSVLSHFHGDGWGLGSLTEIRKEPVAAHLSVEFPVACDEVRADTMVLHLRKASCTLENRRCDTHPWHENTSHGPVVFAHNGHIFDLPALDELVKQHVAEPRFAHTDSGRFLNLVAGLMDTRSIPDALSLAVGLVEDTTTHVALNCVLVAESGLWVMQAANPTMTDWPIPEPPVFSAYNVQQRIGNGVTLAASNSWNHSGDWEPFNNREIRHYVSGELVDVVPLPRWDPGANPIPSEKLLVNPD